VFCGGGGGGACTGSVALTRLLWWGRSESLISAAAGAQVWAPKGCAGDASGLQEWYGACGGVQVFGRGCTCLSLCLAQVLDLYNTCKHMHTHAHAHTHTYTRPHARLPGPWAPCSPSCHRPRCLRSQPRWKACRCAGAGLIRFGVAWSCG